MNWAFKVRYRPASMKKWNTKAKAETTGFLAVIVTTALAIEKTANIEKNINVKLTNFTHIIKKYFFFNFYIKSKIMKNCNI